MANFGANRGGRAIGKRKSQFGQKQLKGKSARGRAPQQRRVESRTELAAPAALPTRSIEESVGDEENEENFKDSSNAYGALLQSLEAKGGSFANAYARRKREEQGASSSDNDDELGEAEMDEIEAEDNLEDDEQAVELAAAADIEVDEQKDDTRGSEEEVNEGDEEVNDNIDEHAESVDGSEDDNNNARVANGGQASICPDPFKSHVEHQLADDEIIKLVEGKEKFSSTVAVKGMHGGSWVFNTSAAPKDEKYLSAYVVKKRLQDSWKGVYQNSSWGDFESEQQGQFFSLCSSYQDILHTGKASGGQEDGKGDQEDQSTMDAYVLHILDHILKTRDVITKNNEKLQHTTSDGGSFDPPRDQGFTRPKILVLLPFRSSALKFVDRLLKLAPHSQKSNVEHKARFFDDFGVEEDEHETVSGSNPAEQKEKKSAKPADFRSLFRGNNDDHFRIGIKFTRKSVKLYSEFYSSDIIIASPVGLITSIGESEVEKDKDIDFLSSIEIAVVDYTDVILMQNWAHVVTVFGHLNRIPAKQHGTDFMRIREWYLNGHASHYLQTIILSSFSDAGVNALFHRTCFNHAGKVKLRCQYEGVLSKVMLQVRQIYEKIDCSVITDVDDSRFDFFVKQIYPRLKNSWQDGTMIFIRSYFDFVRLRNFFKSQSASFCLLGEYSKQSDVSRSRSWFYHGQRRILLYTERAHFFHRYRIRGIKDLIFYSLPDHAHFYTELLNLLEGKENPSCTILFSRFDNLQAHLDS